jgi:hypothetical protein
MDVETGALFGFLRGVGRVFQEISREVSVTVTDAAGARRGVGGASPPHSYAYVRGNPVSITDPTGLAPPGRTESSPLLGFPTYPSDTQLSHDGALGLEDWLDRVANGIVTLCKEAVDECYRRFDQVVSRCERWRGLGPVGDRDRWYHACKRCAADRRKLCYKNKGPDPNEPDEWSQDDIPRDVPGVRK